MSFSSGAVSGEIPLPRYHQVQLALRQRILDGVYDGLMPMPGERELAAEFVVGRVTVRAALAALEKQGLVARRQGKGTFPQVPVSRQGRQELRDGLLKNLVSMGLRTKVTVLELATQRAGEDVAKQLRLEVGAMVIKAVRVRSFKGEPIMYTEVYVPAELGAVLTRKGLMNKPMLVLLEESGLCVDSAEQTLTARSAEPQVALALKVPLGAALLSVSRVVCDHAGKPLQYLLGHYRPDHYEYRMQLSRVGERAGIWVESRAAGQ